MIRTVCIKLKFSSQEMEEFHQLLIQGSSIWDEYVQWFFSSKTSSKKKAHDALYSKIRSEYNIPSAFVQSIRDCASEAIKSVKCKTLPKNKNFSLRYDKRTLSLRGNLLSLSSIGKRKKFLINFPKFFENKPKEWDLVGAQLVYLKKKDTFQLHLNFKKEKPSKKINGCIVGLDRGIYNLITTSNGKSFSGKEIRKNQRKFLYLRKKLSVKGTQSAKRRLRALSGREKRFNRHINHCISKDLSQDKNVKVYVLEDLKGIRKQRKGKILNKWLSSWCFFQLEQFLNYKCEEQGILIEKVDPRYTSQKCSRCGHREKKNRSKSKFLCKKCGYADHADCNAAINIKNNYILSQHLNVEQAPVNVPYVSCLNYTETSPHACHGGS